MTITYWSVRGQRPSGVEYAIEAFWDKHHGYGMRVSWRHDAQRDWDRLPAPYGWRGDYGPYRDLKAAVRAAKRQQKRLEADKGATFDAPKVYETKPMT